MTRRQQQRGIEQEQWSADTWDESRPKPESLEAMMVAAPTASRATASSSTSTTSTTHGCHDSGVSTVAAKSEKKSPPRPTRGRDVKPRSPTRSPSRSNGLGGRTKPLPFPDLDLDCSSSTSCTKNEAQERISGSNARGSMAPTRSQPLPHQHDLSFSRWSSQSSSPVRPRTLPSSRSCDEISHHPPRDLSPTRTINRKERHTKQRSQKLQPQQVLDPSSSYVDAAYRLEMTLKALNASPTTITATGRDTNDMPPVSSTLSATRCNSLHAALGPMAPNKKRSMKNSHSERSRSKTLSSSLSSSPSVPSLNDSTSGNKKPAPLGQVSRGKSPLPVRRSIRDKSPSRARSLSPFFQTLGATLSPNAVDLKVIAEKQGQGENKQTMTRQHKSYEDFKAARQEQQRRNHKLLACIESQARYSRQHQHAQRSHRSEASFLQNKRNDMLNVGASGASSSRSSSSSSRNSTWATTPVKKSCKVPLSSTSPTRKSSFSKRGSHQSRAASPTSLMSPSRSETPPATTEETYTQQLQSHDHQHELPLSRWSSSLTTPLLNATTSTSTSGTMTISRSKSNDALLSLPRRMTSPPGSIKRNVIDTMTGKGLPPAIPGSGSIGTTTTRSRSGHPQPKSPVPILRGIRRKPRSRSLPALEKRSLKVDLSIIEEGGDRLDEEEQHDEVGKVPTMTRQHKSFDDFKAARLEQKRKNRTLSASIKSLARRNLQLQLQQHDNKASRSIPIVARGGGVCSEAEWDAATFILNSHPTPVLIPPPSKAKPASPLVNFPAKSDGSNSSNNNSRPDSNAPPRLFKSRSSNTVSKPMMGTSTFATSNDLLPKSNGDRWASPSSFKKRVESDSGLNQPRRISSPTSLRNQSSLACMPPSHAPGTRGNASWDDPKPSPSTLSSSMSAQLMLSLI
jgi:hypothetical protein